MKKRIFLLLTLFAVSLGYRYAVDNVTPAAQGTEIRAMKAGSFGEAVKKDRIAKKRIVYLKTYNPPAFEGSAPAQLRAERRFVPRASKTFFYTTPYTDLPLRSPPAVR